MSAIRRRDRGICIMSTKREKFQQEGEGERGRKEFRPATCKRWSHFSFAGPTLSRVGPAKEKWEVQVGTGDLVPIRPEKWDSKGPGDVNCFINRS